MGERINTAMPGNLDLRDNTPTVCVVGAGLSGLLTAIQLKEKKLPLQVVVLDKLQTESNTQVSGMRIRAKRAGSSAMLPEERSEEIVGLLAKQNNGCATEPMKEFGRLLTEELIKWNRRLSLIDPEFVNETPEWFGPQWGIPNKNGMGGRGLSVLTLLKSVASKQGIKFLKGEATRLQKTGGTITSIDLSEGNRQYIFRPDVVILANGNAAGRLFLSTNRAIKNSATELLFNAGLALEGGSLIMWHPFGNCRSDGKALLGCHETDILDTTSVFYMGGTKDQETTQLLREHQAHYHFREIAERFFENGGIVQLVNSDGERQFARVSLHYSHLGAHTTDGARVEGMSNLAVTGDAGGLLYWTNHQVRLPGFALAHCLVSARKVSDWIATEFEGNNWIILENRHRVAEIAQGIPRDLTSAQNDLREINTRHSLELEFGKENPTAERISSWATELNHVGETELKPLSLAIVDSWNHIIQGEHEPIFLRREPIKDNIRETSHEPIRESLSLYRRL